MKEEAIIIVSHSGKRTSRITGGAGARTTYIFKALSYYSHRVILQNLCIDCNVFTTYRTENQVIVMAPIKQFVHSLNFVSIDNIFILLKSIESLQNYLELKRFKDIVVVTTDPISLHYWLYTKERLLKDGYNIKILWSPGGNELTCPLHTEVCPHSNSYTGSYGHSISVSWYLTRCVPHILKSRGLNIYQFFVWPLLRKEIIKKVDGILATRSVYIEGCKSLRLKNCAYIGFGVDTNRFFPRPRDEVIKILHNIRSNIENNIVWGDIRYFCDEILSCDSIVLGFIGAVTPPWKNVELIIKVFSIIAKTFENVYLLIVARDAHLLLPLTTTLPESVRKKIVIFNGIPHVYVPVFYNLIDVFINPSLLDSLEVNTIEALVSGNIVLASNRGCINDLRYLGIKTYKIFEPTPTSLLSVLTPILKRLNLYKNEVLEQLSYVRNRLNLYAFGRRLVKAISRLCNDDKKLE